MHLPLSQNQSVRSQEPLPASEGTAPQSKQVKGGQRAIEDLVERQKAIIDAQTAEISRLRVSKERYEEAYEAAKERIAGLEGQIEELTTTHKVALEQQNRRIEAVEDQLRRTKESPATKPTEHTRSKSLLSSPNRVSEAEVLGVVHDLNEHVFQVAAGLTEEWEEFSSSRTDRFTVTKEDVDVLSWSYGPSLVNYLLDRNPAAVTFVVQSCLCELATQITSTWRHNQELKALRSAHKLLSPSEGRETSSRLRSFTQSHLSNQSSHSVSITRHIADILWITGSFPSTRHSLDFVKEKASSGIEAIVRLVLRLESIFMVDIISSDMCLLFEAPCTVFNDRRMTKEVEVDATSTSARSVDIVAGTTEVGVEKSVGEQQGEGRHTEVLLKAKVVLERDLTDL